MDFLGAEKLFVKYLLKILIGVFQNVVSPFKEDFKEFINIFKEFSYTT